VTTNHLWDYKSFLPSAMEDNFTIIVAKMVDLDRSCKCMDKNGHDSL
jgi:hypothetical protein